MYTNEHTRTPVTTQQETNSKLKKPGAPFYTKPNNTSAKTGCQHKNVNGEAFCVGINSHGFRTQSVHSKRKSSLEIFKALHPTLIIGQSYTTKHIINI
jgi:hypothetical protein